MVDMTPQRLWHRLGETLPVDAPTRYLETI